MDAQTLRTVYLCCIAAGFAVPLFQIAAGTLGGLFDLDADFDTDGPFPLNLMSLALFSGVFGALGRLSLIFLPERLVWLSLLIGALFGIAGAAAFGRFILRPLRQNRAEALRMKDLRWQVGTVRLEIREDFYGSVSLLSSVGSVITYSAKPIPGVERIEVGSQVMVVEVDEKKRLCTVSPMKSRLEE